MCGSFSVSILRYRLKSLKERPGLLVVRTTFDDAAGTAGNHFSTTNPVKNVPEQNIMAEDPDQRNRRQVELAIVLNSVRNFAGTWRIRDIHSVCNPDFAVPGRFRVCHHSNAAVKI
jgi:hypothetical protein